MPKDADQSGDHWLATCKHESSLHFTPLSLTHKKVASENPCLCGNMEDVRDQRSSAGTGGDIRECCTPLRIRPYYLPCANGMRAEFCTCQHLRTIQEENNKVQHKGTLTLRGLRFN